MNMGKSYLADGLPVGNGVGSLGALVTRLEVIADECGTKGLDHKVVVVQSCDNDGGVNAIERSRDVGSRHFD